MFNGICFSGYKSFSSETDITLDKIGRITLFIGKNNCGKSSALDVVGITCDASTLEGTPAIPKKICRGYAIDPELFRRSYLKGASFPSSRPIPEDYYTLLLWSRVKFTQSYSKRSRYTLSEEFKESDNDKLCKTTINLNHIFEKRPTKRYKFIKISAERNIVPEEASNECVLLPNGNGATNLIRRIVNNNRFDENLIEKNLLGALNKIMDSDAQFESIRVQECRHDEEKNSTIWEVYLQEKGSERFPLSQSGSGLKTIVLVLLNLLVIPTVQNREETLVYGFEELENNLHPALQRRLFEYLYHYAHEKNVHIFLTTHSHVAINLLYEKQDAVLYHVVKENGTSSIKRIQSYIDKIEILDDLDVKASDLLQANGIVWVEGPSDRVYIKRWLEVFCGTEVQEGKDFQFAYYGGRLLSHYSTEEATDLLNILLINRNSAIIMDSDKRARATPINETKKRIEREFRDKTLFSWITKGKEIENYVSFRAINTALQVELEEQCETYELFPEYIKKYYSNFSGNKVKFANTIKPYIDTTDVLDLSKQIQQLYEAIKSWNKR